MENKKSEPFDLSDLPGDASTELQPTIQPSSLSDVLVELNDLKETGIINDYAIGGGYASIYHGVPYTTFDLDVLLVLNSDEDFHKLWDYYLQKGNKISQLYIYIAGMPVQFLPNINPLFNEAVTEAMQLELNGVSGKVVTVEYLIVLLLTSFRVKDRIKIAELIKDANIIKLKEILRRFDDEQGQLSKRLDEFLEIP